MRRIPTEPLLGSCRNEGLSTVQGPNMQRVGYKVFGSGLTVALRGRTVAELCDDWQNSGRSG